MKINILLLIFFFQVSILSCQNEKVDARLVGLDNQIDNLRERFHNVGLAIAVIEKGETIYTKGYGFRDLEQKIPVDTNTVFGIGSITKSFTASLLGMLEADGKLSLSDRPSEYIPELKFHNSAMDYSIQIRNLLSHSTGLSAGGAESSSILFGPDKREEMIERIQHIRPQTNVGERFIYNNLMYTLSGILAERITGKNWETNIKERIFEPVGMTQSFVGVKEAQQSPEFSFGYCVENDLRVKVLPEILPARQPAGDIYCSITDLAKWAKLWLNDGMTNGKTIIPSDYLQAAISPQQIISGGPGPRNSQTARFVIYGYGWFSSDFHGYYQVAHSGGISGYTSNCVFFPAEEVGVVVLSNQNISGLSNVVTNAILERIFDLPKTHPDSVQVRFSNVVNVVSDTATTIINQENPPTHDLKNFEGIYSHPGYGDVKIIYQNKALKATLPFTTFLLSHQRDNLFWEAFTEDVPQVMSNFLDFNFVPNEAGEVNELHLNVETEPVVFRRIK